jgi:rhodanese-related sulfurtransferase
VYIEGGMGAWVKAGNPMEEKALTFMQMTEEAMVQVQGISAAEALDRLEQDPNTLLIDVSDAADVLKNGLAAGGVNISLGMLPVRADLELPEEWRYAGLQDRSRPIITTCQAGPNGARAAKLLDDMGFTNVVYMEGGTAAWVEAGYPMQESE